MLKHCRRYLGLLALCAFTACVEKEPQPITEISPASETKEAPAPTPIPIAPKTLTGPLNGAFVYWGEPDAPRFTDAQIPQVFKELRELGFEFVVISGLRHAVDTCESKRYAWTPGLPDQLPKVFETLAALEMHAYIAVTGTQEHCNPAQRNRFSQAINADIKMIAKMLEEKWGKNEVFRGWYIPDEPGLGEAATYPFYQAVVKTMRSISKDKPILIAPYLAGATTRKTPQDVAQIAKNFMEATRDATGQALIQVWQDGVGAAGVNLYWERDLGSAEDYYKAIGAAIGREHLWSDHELFNCCVPPFAGGPYDSADIVRIQEQMRQASTDVVAQRTAWLPQIHLGTIDKNRQSQSARLQAAYKALFLNKSMVAPASYTWITTPAPEYADSGSELTNQKIGDPKNVKNAEWIGINGAAAVKINLGQATKVNFVGWHLLSDSAAAVKLPSELRLQCLDDRDQVTQEHVEPLGFTPAKGAFEYSFGNRKALGWHCVGVKAQFANTQWTFMSEVSIH